MLAVTRSLQQHPQAAPQPGELVSLAAPWTTASARSSEATTMASAIREALAVPPAKTSSRQWSRALQAMGLTRSRPNGSRERFAEALTADPPLPDPLLRQFLEISSALFPGELLAETAQAASRTASPKTFAMAVHHVTRNDPERAAAWIPAVTAKFPSASQHPILRVLLWQLDATARQSWLGNLPDLRALLTAPFTHGIPVIFSLQRHNRDWPGRAILRLPDLSFARHADGSLFSVPQLARSVSALPGVITNGNTPQGIHAWNGLAVSSNRYIGPTPNLQLSLPFEFPAHRFFFSPQSPEAMSEQAYASLLPPSWQTWPPIWEAFFAGMAGRSEIIAHGTTIDPSWHRGQPWFPISPSHGCLTTPESWNEGDGSRSSSAQDDLVRRLHFHGLTRGYVVVIDFSLREAPVSPQELTTLLPSS
jgi:hypothetical protein